MSWGTKPFGASVLGATGSRVRCPKAASRAEPWPNGGRPVKSSNAIAPKEYTSLFGSASRPRICSGAAVHGDAIVE
jgi:hypothetical protein